MKECYRHLPRSLPQGIMAMFYFNSSDTLSLKLLEKNVQELIRLIPSSSVDQYSKTLVEAEYVFNHKLDVYGVSWRQLRLSTLTDQVFIKASRVRTLSFSKGLVSESIPETFIGIINYSAIYLIKAKGAYSTLSQVKSSYSQIIQETQAIMVKKNHDYGEAWKLMRKESFSDMILQKLERVRNMEDSSDEGLPLDDEKKRSLVDSYHDIINYAVFAVIKYNE